MQLVGDFLADRPSDGAREISSRPIAPAGAWPDLADCLPGYVTETLRLALPFFDKRLPGFARADAVLTGVETRSSSPVRIVRDDAFESNIRGLYPAGEGAGYAGGIMSPVDGMRAAEAIRKYAVRRDVPDRHRARRYEHVGMNFRRGKRLAPRIRMGCPLGDLKPFLCIFIRIG